jgi:hypothetical protein
LGDTQTVPVNSKFTWLHDIDNDSLLQKHLLFRLKPQACRRGKIREQAKENHTNEKKTFSSSQKSHKLTKSKVDCGLETVRGCSCVGIFIARHKRHSGCLALSRWGLVTSVVLSLRTSVVVVVAIQLKM